MEGDSNEGALCRAFLFLRKVTLRGVQRVRCLFTFTVAIYNLVRIRNLPEIAA